MVATAVSEKSTAVLAAWLAASCAPVATRASYGRQHQRRAASTLWCLCTQWRACVAPNSLRSVTMGNCACIRHASCESLDLLTA